MVPQNLQATKLIISTIIIIIIFVIIILAIATKKQSPPQAPKNRGRAEEGYTGHEEAVTVYREGRGRALRNLHKGPK